MKPRGGRCSELGRKPETRQHALERAESERVLREAALEQTRQEIARQEKARHDAQIEQLKLSQAEERYRERKAQLEAERAELTAEGDAGRVSLAASERAASAIGEEITAARSRVETSRNEHIAGETALAEQRRAVQQADREAQDAVFGERECSSKIAEIDHSVRVIDQQIDRADAEVLKLTAELAADPIPAVRQALEAAVETRIACEKTLAEARNTVEVAAGALREIEEARLAVEAKVAPLRERLGELKLKEQAASLNFEQYATQLREADADETRLGTEAPGA